MYNHQFHFPLVNFSEFLSCLIFEWSRGSYKGDCLGVYSFDKICAAESYFKEFFCSFEELFSYFSFHLFLVVLEKRVQLFGWLGFMAYQTLLVIGRQTHFYENSSF